MTDIGQRIKLLVKERKIKVPELAEKLGRSKQNIYAIFKGEQKVSTELLEEISEILEVSPGYFWPELEQARELAISLNKSLKNLNPDEDLSDNFQTETDDSFLTYLKTEDRVEKLRRLLATSDNYSLERDIEYLLKEIMLLKEIISEKEEKIQLLRAQNESLGESMQKLKKVSN